jgi:hypothetical protein
MADAPFSARQEARFTLALGLPREQAWRRLAADIDQWWPAAYRVSAAGSCMRLGAVPGGALLEDAGQGNGVLWYTVQAVDAPASMVLAGFIAPPFGGPALSLLRLSITERDGGHCVLEVHDSLLGHADAAAVEAGWRDIFGNFAWHVTQERGARESAQPESQRPG